MKKCLECGAQVDDGAYVCPTCGGRSLMGSYSGAEALAMLDSLEGMGKAAQHVDRSAHLYMENRLEEAKAELRLALELAPQNATAHGNMGSILLKEGKNAEAVPWLEKALELNPALEGVPAALAQAKAGAQKSACFVATACYGDPDCTELRVLRGWRDERLAASAAGRLFVRGYYAVSPPLAHWLARHPRARRAVRERLLTPLVARIRPDR